MCCLRTSNALGALSLENWLIDAHIHNRQSTLFEVIGDSPQMELILLRDHHVVSTLAPIGKVMQNRKSKRVSSIMSKKSSPTVTGKENRYFMTFCTQNVTLSPLSLIFRYCNHRDYSLAVRHEDLRLRALAFRILWDNEMVLLFKFLS